MPWHLYTATQGGKTTAFYASDRNTARAMASAYFGAPASVQGATAGDVVDDGVDSGALASALEAAKRNLPQRFVIVPDYESADDDDSGDW